MTKTEKQRLSIILWSIADDLRGSMNADDFRDYTLAFLFLRYLSDNYEAAAKKELGRDYPDPTDLGLDLAKRQGGCRVACGNRPGTMRRSVMGYGRADR